MFGLLTFLVVFQLLFLFDLPVLLVIQIQASKYVVLSDDVVEQLHELVDTELNATFGDVDIVAKLIGSHLKQLILGDVKFFKAGTLTWSRLFEQKLDIKAAFSVATEDELSVEKDFFREFIAA